MANILIIEDQEPLRVLYKYVFRQYDHETTFATTGEAGIEAALRERPDLVILDLLLPDIPGIEVPHRLRGVWNLARCAVGHHNRAGRTVCRVHS